MGSSANLQVKADGREKRKIRRKYKSICRKKILFYSLHLAQGGPGWPQVVALPQVTSGVMGFLGGSHVAYGDRGWPTESEVPYGVMDGLVGMKMTFGPAGGLVGSWVAMAMHGGSRVASGGCS
jgi:hypothetical protein